MKSNATNYHKRIRDLPCLACNSRTDIVVHHFAGGSDARRGWKGDFLVIPLCTGCHTNNNDAVHEGKRSFYERTGIDPYAEAAANYVRFLDGRYEKEDALKRLVCEEE